MNIETVSLLVGAGLLAIGYLLGKWHSTKTIANRTITNAQFRKLFVEVVKIMHEEVNDKKVLDKIGDRLLTLRINRDVE